MTTRLRKHKAHGARLIGRTFLRPGDHVLDVGAADGTYAAIWAEMVGPHGRVLAIEPNRTSAASLRAAGFACLEAAVGRSVGRDVFHAHTHAPKRSSLYAGNVGAHRESYPVALTTIDTVVASMPQPPRLIKVDAQGAEAAIVRGAAHSLTLPIVWVLELWRDGLTHAGASIGEVLRPFQKRRFVPADVLCRSMGWRTAERDAERKTGASSTDILLVPAALARSLT